MFRRYLIVSFAIALSACADAHSGTSLASTDAADSITSQPLAAVEIGALTLRVQQGELVGHTVAGGVREFLGIPFAQPPVADLRWAQPEPSAAWPEPRVADHFGPRCPQASSHGAPNELESEDCLYLNVWAPADSRSAAVMVWIHGGGNRDGTASDFFTGGATLAARYGVVVVTLNYRLGVLGFLAHPELQAQQEGQEVANQGLWDQQLALRWTQANIAAFGGDPKRVTIFGESAGSADVCLQLAAPSSRDLFARAISQSGGCTTRRKGLEAAQRDTAQLAEQLGCTEDTLTCLRASEVPQLFAAADALGSKGIGFGPVVDGNFTPEQPRALYDRGEIAQVPYLIGSNSDEGSAFTLDAASLSDDAQYLDALKRLSADAEAVLALYPVSKFSKAKNPYQAAFARAWGDSRMVCSTLDVAVRAASAGLPVFMYNFDMSMDGPDGVFGAAHAFEIGFVFGTLPGFTTEQRIVSDRMQGYWTELAKNGDPNASDLQPWPRFEASADVRVNFAETTSVVHDFRGPECTFWRAQYDRAF